jgi:hypothetical protein
LEGIAEYLETAANKTDRIRPSLLQATELFKEMLSNLQKDLRTHAARVLRSESADEKTAARSLYEPLFDVNVSLVGAYGQIITTTLEILRDFDPDQGAFERLYGPEMMERDLKTETLIKKEIDRDIARLVQSKEYEKMYGKHSQEQKEALTFLDSPKITSDEGSEIS